MDIQAIASLIDRVGFSAMAFLLMSYMCFVTLRKLTDAITENTLSLQNLTLQFAEHRIWTRNVVEDLKRSHDKRD